MISTFLVLGLFFVVALLPKVPWYVKIVVQLIIGAVVYFVFSDTMFDLPMGDSFPSSSIFGGAPSEEMGGDGSFNKYALGVLGTVLGIVGTFLMTGAYALFGKKSDGES